MATSPYGRLQNPSEGSPIHATTSGWRVGAFDIDGAEVVGVGVGASEIDGAGVVGAGVGTSEIDGTGVGAGAVEYTEPTFASPKNHPSIS